VQPLLQWKKISIIYFERVSVALSFHHLWPVRLYHIFQIISQMELFLWGDKVIQDKMRV